MLEALCRQSSTTLDIMHAEDGPPITQRTSGLGLRVVAGLGTLEPDNSPQFGGPQPTRLIAM